MNNGKCKCGSALYVAGRTQCIECERDAWPEERKQEYDESMSAPMPPSSSHQLDLATWVTESHRGNVRGGY